MSDMTEREAQLTRLCQEVMGVMILAFLMHPHPDKKQEAAVLKVEKMLKDAGIAPIPAKYVEKTA